MIDTENDQIRVRYYFPLSDFIQSIPTITFMTKHKVLPFVDLQGTDHEIAHLVSHHQLSLTLEVIYSISAIEEI